MISVVERLVRERPRVHSGGASIWNALPEILTVLASSLDSSTRSIETGCGASTVIFAAAGGEHTTISPDARGHTLVKEYCERSGIDHSNVTFHAASSDVVLPGI